MTVSKKANEVRREEVPSAKDIYIGIAKAMDAAIKYEEAAERRLRHIRELDEIIRKKNEKLHQRGMKIQALIAAGGYAEYVKHAQTVEDNLKLIDRNRALDAENAALKQEIGRIKRERVRRPTILAADGEPLEAGQTVWEVGTEVETPMTVIDVDHDLARCEYTWKDGKVYRPCFSPDRLTHQRPVLDADGVPIKVNDVGYPTYTNCSCIDPSHLTHAKPEPTDSWERLEDDADRTASLFSAFDSNASADIRDIVRRCKKLAGVDK